MYNSINPIYKRVILKISGEILHDFNKSELTMLLITKIAKDIKNLLNFGVSFGIVIGGGNLFRGKDLSKIGINRVLSDRIGMLSTMINALFIKDVFNKLNIKTCLMSSISAHSICEDYNLDKAIDLLSRKVVVIFCSGLGNPLFTTDSAACLRAIETHSDIIIKGTKVNGVYSDDPIKEKNAIFYTNLNYQEVLKKELQVMDLTAFVLARDNNLPICIFNINRDGALYRIIQGHPEGTMITR